MKRCLVLCAIVGVAVLGFSRRHRAFGFLTQWGSGGTADGQFGESAGPEGIASRRRRQLYVVDRGNSRVQEFNPTGGFITKWGTFGPADGQFNTPFGIAADSAGNLYVVDTFNYRVEKFSSAGAFIGPGGGVSMTAPLTSRTAPPAARPARGHGRRPVPQSTGVAVGAGGSVYVIGDGDERVQKFDSDGNFVGKWGSPGTGDLQFDHPVGIATDAAGNVYVADTDNERVSKFDSDGGFITKWGSTGTGDGQFATGGPEGIAVDSADNVYVTDVNADRVQEFSSTGTFLAKFGEPGTGDGQFNTPQGITVDAAATSTSQTRSTSGFRSSASRTSEPPPMVAAARLDNPRPDRSARRGAQEVQEEEGQGAGRSARRRRRSCPSER